MHKEEVLGRRRRPKAWAVWKSARTHDPQRLGIEQGMRLGLTAFLLDLHVRHLAGRVDNERQPGFSAYTRLVGHPRVSRVRTNSRRKLHGARRLRFARTGRGSAGACDAEGDHRHVARSHEFHAVSR